MDITTITAAQASIKALMGLAKGATAAVVDSQLKDRLIDIQSGILDVQAKLGDAQAERLKLLGQVAELKEKIRVLERARDVLNDYQLHEVGPGRFLYKYLKGAPDHVEHFACPTCYDGGKITVLQSPKTGSQQTTYICKTCRFSLAVGASDPLPSVRRGGSWMSY